ncbi:MAG: hypothetical protein QG605_50 [Euryarchaeota archaeon]|nr:hypothetical protein [Euryarchaeota archaeon]
MDLELNIEELRLHGFKRADREKIAAAVQAELERLFSEEGLPSGLKHGSEIRQQGGSFSLPAGLKPEKAGEQLARQMYERWK